MILSEHTRRWVEIKFYYFCYDIYQVKHNIRDVVLAVEAVAQIGTVSTLAIKRIAAELLSDPYHLPIKTEIVMLGDAHGLKASEIAKITGSSQDAIRKMLKRKQGDYLPCPHLYIDEDSIIKEFLDLLELFKKAGI